MFVKKTLLQIGNVVFLAKLQGFFPLGSGLWGRTHIYLMSEYNSCFQNIYIIFFLDPVSYEIVRYQGGWGGGQTQIFSDYYLLIASNCSLFP